MRNYNRSLEPSAPVPQIVCLRLHANKNGGRMVDHIKLFNYFLIFVCDPMIINGANLKNDAII